MTRDEMLSILHRLKLGVELVALTAEEALECTYITSKGICYEWRGLYDWPHYKLKNSNFDKLQDIWKKVKNNTLTLGDLEDTEFRTLCSSEMGADPDFLNMFFRNIDKICCSDEKTIYVSVDDDVAFFFETYSAFEKAFEERLSLDRSWEDMPDDELAEWIERVSNDELRFPFSEFEE